MPVYDNIISNCDLFLNIFIDKSNFAEYNSVTMIIKHLLLASESYTHKNWEFRNVNVTFSRLYYIIDGEAYYEENGQAVRFKKNHLYLTPVKQSFNLYENPDDKLLHTYVHITTLPVVTRFTEIEVIPETPLADAVALWRKYIHSGDYELIANIVQFLISQINEQYSQSNTIAEQIKQYLDTLEVGTFDISVMSRKLGYSREHITRVFHTVYRTTPRQYFNIRNMNLGLKKLCDGEKVKVVAEELNFASPYSFSKAFKKHFGSSPMQYLATLKTGDSSRNQVPAPSDKKSSHEP